MSKTKLSYFLQITPIWNDYEKGKIGVGERERRLAPFRKTLAEQQFNVNKKMKSKNQTVAWLVNQ